MPIARYDRTAGAVICALIMLGGCTQQDAAPPPPSPEQMAASQQNRARGGKRTIEEIGRLSFGSGLKESKSDKGTVSYSFTPKLDGEPGQNFDRMLTIAGTAAQTTFSQHESTKVIRITAVHSADPNRKLLVYSLTKESSRGVDWMHGADAGAILKAVKVEYVDPEYKGFAVSGQ